MFFEGVVLLSSAYPSFCKKSLRKVEKQPLRDIPISKYSQKFGKF